MSIQIKQLVKKYSAVLLAGLLFVSVPVSAVSLEGQTETGNTQDIHAQAEVNGALAEQSMENKTSEDAASRSETSGETSESNSVTQNNPGTQNNLGTSAPAETSGNTQEKGESAEPTENSQGSLDETEGSEGSISQPLTFKIEDTKRYTGMERSYEKGYLPVVQNGKVLIVLPLITDSKVQGNMITVTPELGSTSDSPFIYRNYQTTVKESSEIHLDAVPDEKPVPMYLVQLELDLSGDRYDGVYPVGIKVEARDTGGMTVTQNFTTYVTITDGKSREVEAPAETKPDSQPFLYIENYRINPDPVVAGEEFTITASICNAHEKQDVKNLVFTVSSGTDQLTLREESSTILWDELEAGESRELTLRYKADSLISVGKYHIQLSMSFEDKKVNKLSSSGDLTVSVTQPMRLTGEYPRINEGANAGDTISLDFQAVNMGKSAAYNVRFELDAAGLIPSGSAYIGNLEGGSAGSAQMKVFVGAKSMNRELEEGEELYGYTSGTMTMIYEDENGNEYREEEHFSTNIYELVIGSGEVEEEPEGNTDIQWWISVGGGAVIILAVCGAALWQRKKRERA